ncbi:hypothetical protein L596_026089 [Steinernema carpocapsae]|uniref:Uncharacterized protein n=1 Tax=Steinernema carpocapsae TaxID=34508 RepID=A0A4U5M0F1_STECR|nr:hypothetical protein L596_026089 [Steinernema carpocapsae]
MIQQGVVQCLSAPSSFIFGVAVLLNYDSYNLSLLSEKLANLILSIGTCIIYVTSPTTFIVYILLVAYLIRQAKQVHSLNVNFKQKWIFAQALIKHISEIVLVTVYAFVANG